MSVAGAGIAAGVGVLTGLAQALTSGKKKKEAALEKWFDEKTSGYYIKIDDEYKSCPTLKRWVQIANALKK